MDPTRGTAVSVAFRRYRPDPDEEERLAEMMRALDAEGAGIRPIDEGTLARTLAYLRAPGGRAVCAVAVEPGGALVGYAILVPFWSCEYGGELLLLDELWVARERRSRGVGGRFVAWIEALAVEMGCVAITLGAMGHNRRAMEFYLGRGFNRLDIVTFDKLLQRTGGGRG